MGHGHDRKHAHWGILDLERPLGFGLLVRRQGMSDRLFRRSRNPALAISDVALNKRIEARAAETEHAHALLQDPEVRAALTELSNKWPDVVVTDRAVRVHLRRPESTVRRVMSLVNGMMRLAQAVDEARQRIDPPEELAQLRPTWHALAEQLGLESEGWLPAMAGSVEQRRIVVCPTRASDGSHSALLWLYFGPHRDTGLRLRPQVEPDGYWSVGQDIQVGNDAFDQAFVIKGYDPERVRSMLNADAKAALLKLNAHGSLEVDDRKLHLRHLALDTESVGNAVRHACQVADALEW